jgi:hypothetical protein
LLASCSPAELASSSGLHWKDMKKTQKKNCRFNNNTDFYGVKHYLQDPAIFSKRHFIIGEREGKTAKGAEGDF